MSYIPSHAMPHAYVHDEDEQDAGKCRAASGRPTTALVIGGAVLGFLLFRALR